MNLYTKINTIGVAAVLSLAMIGGASAQVLEETVRAGKTTKVYSYAVFSQTNCRDAVAVRLSSARSKNGKLTSRRGTFTPSSGLCKGIPVKSTDVYFTPASGFRGTETVRFRMVYDKYLEEVGPVVSKGVRIKITVK